MSERVERFRVAGIPFIVLRVPSGDARVVAGDPGEVVVRLRGSDRELARYIIEERGNTVTVEPDRSQRGRVGSVGVVVEVGEAPSLQARVTSGDLSVETGLNDLTIDTAAGDVRAGDIADGARVKSASGDVRLGSVGGRLSVATAAGDVVVAGVGRSLDVKSASGDVSVARAGGDVSVRSAAGDVRIGSFEGDDLDVKTMSGDVSIGVAAGGRYRLSLNSLSGDVRTDFAVSDEKVGVPARLSVRSISGDIRIEPAAR